MEGDEYWVGSWQSLPHPTSLSPLYTLPNGSNPILPRGDNPNVLFWSFRFSEVYKCFFVKIFHNFKESSTFRDPTHNGVIGTGHTQ